MPAPQPHVRNYVWFKSSYSGGNTTECVECARTAAGTLVRDSKRPEGPVLAVEAGAWRAFVGAVGSLG
ncbi:DUF397 domain-containing protein [Streptomyces sp. NPDC014870]|uniref:DUF397 domain-containing protein n=1 Tax=Streptomyces sp. NPDC014870 TaxID=3364925 RepID=UPI0036F75AC6